MSNLDKYRRQIDRLPELRALKAAFMRDQALEEKAQKIVHRWAEELDEDDYIDADEDGLSFSMPTIDDGFLWEEGLAEHFPDEIAPQTKKALMAFAMAAGQLAERQGWKVRYRGEKARREAYWDAAQEFIVDFHLPEWFDERWEEGYWDDDLEDIRSEMADAAYEARDPYGYRGLSRRDFMAKRVARRYAAKLG